MFLVKHRLSAHWPCNGLLIAKRLFARVTVARVARLVPTFAWPHHNGPPVDTPKPRRLDLPVFRKSTTEIKTSCPKPASQ